MDKKIIFSILISAALIVGAIYAPKIKLPIIWKVYEDASLGISFKYPSNLSVDYKSENLIQLSSHDDMYHAITINRSYGFGSGKTTENVFNTLNLNPEPSVEKIVVDGKGAIISTESYDTTQKTIYVLVDDSLFVISLYEVDPEKFIKNLFFSNPQSLSNYRTENVSTSTKRFIDRTYSYQIDIPIDFGFKVNGDYIYFRDPFDGPSSGISMYVSTKKPIDQKNETGIFDVDVTEEKTRIGGVNATITHVGEKMIHELPDHKSVAFSKKGVYFRINTQYLDHEAVWKSFKFIEQ